MDFLLFILTSHEEIHGRKKALPGKESPDWEHPKVELYQWGLKQDSQVLARATDLSGSGGVHFHPL